MDINWGANVRAPVSEALLSKALMSEAQVSGRPLGPWWHFLSLKVFFPRDFRSYWVIFEELNKENVLQHPGKGGTVVELYSTGM